MGRRRTSKEVRDLIFRMVAENCTWGSTAQLIGVQAMPQFGRRLKAPTFRAYVPLSCSGDPRLVPWAARFFMRMKFWRGTARIEEFDLEDSSTLGPFAG